MHVVVAVSFTLVSPLVDIYEEAIRVKYRISYNHHGIPEAHGDQEDRDVTTPASLNKGNAYCDRNFTLTRMY